MSISGMPDPGGRGWEWTDLTGLGLNLKMRNSLKGAAAESSALTDTQTPTHYLCVQPCMHGPLTFCYHIPHVVVVVTTQLQIKDLGLPPTRCHEVSRQVDWTLEATLQAAHMHTTMQLELMCTELHMIHRVGLHRTKTRKQNLGHERESSAAH